MTTAVELETVPCDLCGEADAQTLFLGRDYRFGRTQQYPVVQCNSCGLVRLNPRPTQQALVRLYDEDYPVEDGLADAEGTRLGGLLRAIWHRVSGYSGERLIARAYGRVVDVGCGYGKLLFPLERKGCEVYGVEVNHRCVEACRAAGLSVTPGTLEEAALPTGLADCVILSQVLEHLASPRRTLREIYHILKPGGRVFVFCPNGDGYLRDVFGKYWHGWHVPFHLFVFTAGTITRLADETGFRVDRTRTVTPDDFLSTSLQSRFFGEPAGVRASERDKVFKTLLFRALTAPALRLLDVVLKAKGDCLEVELVKL